MTAQTRRIRELIKEQIISIKDKVDAIFLGYAFCQSLKEIESEFDIPIVMPEMDDCIQILMPPQKYASEIRKEVGTWFMTPGWAEGGAEMVIKELHADRVIKYGKDPLEVVKRLFVHYRGVLYVDTGVGGDGVLINKATEFCRTFGLKLDKTEGTLSVLEQHLQTAREIAAKIKRPFHESHCKSKVD